MMLICRRRCHPAARQTDLAAASVTKKPCHLWQFLPPAAEVLSQCGRCSFTSCGAFTRIPVLGLIGCSTALAAARCPRKTAPRWCSCRQVFCPFVQHRFQLCQFPACWAVPPAVRGRSASPVGEGCPNIQAIPKKKKQPSCMAVPLTVRGCSASPVSVGCRFPVG